MAAKQHAQEEQDKGEDESEVEDYAEDIDIIDSMMPKKTTTE